MKPLTFALFLLLPLAIDRAGARAEDVTLATQTAPEATRLERSYNPSQIPDLVDAPIDLALGAQQIVDEGSSAIAAASMDAAAMSIPRPGSSNLVEATFAALLISDGLQPSAALSVAPLEVIHTERVQAEYQKVLVRRAKAEAFGMKTVPPKVTQRYGYRLGRSFQLSLASASRTTRVDVLAQVQNRTSFAVGASLYDSSWADDPASCAFNAADAADALDRIVRSVRQEVLERTELSAMSSDGHVDEVHRATTADFKEALETAHRAGKLSRVEGGAQRAFQYGMMLLVARGTGERSSVLSQFFRERMKFCVTRPYRFVLATGAATGFRIEHNDQFSFDRALGFISLDLGKTLTEASGWGWAVTGMFRGGYANGLRLDVDRPNTGVYQLGARLSLPSRWCSFAAETLKIRDWFVDRGETAAGATMAWGVLFGASLTLPIALGFSASGSFHMRTLRKDSFDAEQLGLIALNWRRGPNYETGALKTFRRYYEP